MGENYKKYPIPSEIIDILSESHAYTNLKERYSKIPFGFKRAVKCGKEASKLNRRFWKKVYELHSELEGHELWVKTLEEYVYIKEDNDDRD